MMRSGKPPYCNDVRFVDTGACRSLNICYRLLELRSTSRQTVTMFIETGSETMDEDLRSNRATLAAPPPLVSEQIMSRGNPRRRSCCVTLRYGL